MTTPETKPLLPSEYSADAAQAAHCWFGVDRVPRDLAMTEWKRRARFAQAQWREARGYPIGSEPYAGGPRSMPIGSRMELEFARASGANFITPGAIAAVRARLAAPEHHQLMREDALWADLLSSMTLCFNLFGELADHADAAQRTVRSWWPEAPAGDVRVRFEHSPGRSDPAFLANKSAFDVAFEIDHGSGAHALIGVETKYHEHPVAEPPPKPAALARYVEVTERSSIFAEGWREKIVGTELQQLWLDHLLVLSMLQHPSKRWTWGRFVLVYPSDNPGFAATAAKYRSTLRDAATFEVRTLESLLESGALAPDTTAAIASRYLAGKGPIVGS